MKYIKIMAAMLFFLYGSDSVAQKKKNVEPEKTEAHQASNNLLYENMLESTQKVFVVDSVVADKNSFLDHIPIPPEMGKLTYYDQFFGTTGHPDSYVFVNELGNKAYYSLTDKNGHSAIFTMDRLGERWSKAVRVAGIEGENSPSMPFMMPDGITLYFAQQGDGSVGGSDIFVTRYDSESGRFLKANNVGFPFNSKSNEYLYVEDELDSIGWFVTDRRQPEGMVCIYTFVPSKKRQNLDLTNLSRQQVANYADLTCLRDTWPNEKAHADAMKRIQQIRQRMAHKMGGGKSLFVINDMTSYASSADFRSDEARQMYVDLLQARERMTAESERLDAMRDQYANANDMEKNQMKQVIMETERQLEVLKMNIAQTEKAIRNAENKKIK